MQTNQVNFKFLNKNDGNLDRAAPSLTEHQEYHTVSLPKEVCYIPSQLFIDPSDEDSPGWEVSRGALCSSSRNEELVEGCSLELFRYQIDCA